MRFCYLFLLLLSVGAVSAEPNGASAYESLNNIPAQVVLFDPVHTPDTRIDLTEVFKQHAKFEHIMPRLEIVSSGKKEVAVAELQDGVLVVTWKGIGKSQVTIRATNPATGQFVDDRIKLEAWEPSFWQMALTVVGGLGLFLLGMKFLSDGLQMYAGASLRKMIATLTDNRFSAVLVGLATTVLIQSSSVTTVMTVGFINSQIMTLSQGIGVIMGANIGTTVTAWIMILKISQYGLPIIGLSGFVYLFSKSEKIRFLAMGALGLGFVFFGLELMQNGMSALRDLPAFTSILNRFVADSYWGVLKCIAAGCIVTLVVQSSSATIGITLSLVTIGVIDFNSAAALILGENIGTTITALLASIGTSANARRAAIFHCMFNVLGVLWVSTLFLWAFIPTVIWIVGADPETGNIADPRTGVAVTHTLFNVINTLLFLPFTRIAADLLTKYVSPNGDAKEQKPRLTSLNTRLLETSSISIEHSRYELQRMGMACIDLVKWVQNITESDKRDEELIEQSFRQEELLDAYQDEIIEFVAELLAGNVSHEVSITARGQLRMADELESISDYLIVILKSHLKLSGAGLAIPDAELAQMKEVYHGLDTYLNLVISHYAQRKADGELQTEVHSQGRYLTHRVKTIRDNFLRRMSDEKFDPQVIAAINTQLNAFRRVREHTQNVAEAFWSR